MHHLMMQMKHSKAVYGNQSFMKNINIAAIILAAGASKRMGMPKQLLPFGGKPAIACCVEKILESGIQNLIVVLGHHAEHVQKALNKYPVKLVRNHHLEQGMIGSVQCGISTLDTPMEAVLILPCDYMIRACTIKSLVKRFQKIGSACIVRPTYKGIKGHPVLFHRRYFQQIQRASMLREVVRNNIEMVYDVNVEDEGITIDMDTWDDYIKMNLLYQTDSSRSKLA